MSESAVVPTRPHTLRTSLVRTADELRLHCWIRDWGPGFFMLLWLTGWTVGCVFLARQALAKPQVFTLLFAVPFWASWVFVFCALLRSFFRVESLVLDAAGARFARRVLVPLSSRRIPLEELKAATRFSSVVDPKSGRTQGGLELATTGRPLRLLQGLPADELRWLEYQINEHLAELRQQAGLAPADSSFFPEPAPAAPHESPAPAAAPDASHPAADDAADDADDASLLILSAAPTGPPTDSRWRMSAGDPDLAFTRRGRLSLAAIGGLLFINLFWNGIVSVFVTTLWGGGQAGQVNAPQGIGWWGLFVFLIPFEVIGLVMFGSFLGALAEPFHRTRWLFTAAGIERRNTWLGIGRRQSWPVERLGRLDLRRETAKQAGPLKDQIGSEFSDATFRIVFVTPDTQELCAIRRLTEGEARWIAQTVLCDRAAWFR